MINKNSIASVKVNTIGIETICIDSIFAQYNPNRFKILNRFLDSRYPKLSILSMPHYALLDYYVNNGLTKTLATLDASPYGMMQVKYGKRIDWARNKVSTFISMFEDFKDKKIIEGLPIISEFTELPVIAEKPLFDNPYNDGCEIYEGHHRLACLLYLMNSDKNISRNITCYICRKVD